MQVINRHEDIRIDGSTIVALGTFDGVHVGHLVILEDAIRIAKERNLTSVCYTFSNHPYNYVMKRAGKEDRCVKLICTEDEKLRILEELGFDIVVNVPFDESMMTMEAGDFVQDILRERLHSVVACCGFNYTFGSKAQGNATFLKEEGSKIGMDVSMHDAVEIEGTVVSSTAIREAIDKGDMERCNRFLGRAYALDGKVTHGEHLGTQIGFPTANVEAPLTMALPPNGVYYTRAIIDGKSYPAVSDIGTKPTVGGKVKSIETNIFGFNEDVYDHDARVEFLFWKRPEVRFESVEALREQIAKDAKAALEYHKKFIELGQKI